MRKRQPISLGLFPWITETVFQLATHANPAVVVQFREELLSEKVKPEVREALETWGPRIELLRSQRPDGGFGTARAPAETVFLTAGRLLELHDHGLRGDSPAVKSAAAFLEKNQRSDGSLPLHYHHNAFVLWVALLHGLSKRPLVKRLVGFFEERRRRDSGWLDPELEPELAKKDSSPSCPWTTLHVLLGLTELREQCQDIAVRRGALFLLQNMFKRSHNSFFGHPDHWRELDYGYEPTACFKWAVPKVLLTLGRLGCGPETKEVADLLLFLRKTLRGNARWGAGVEGDDFLTLRVLRSLHAVQCASEA
ncbi:MAG: terpene cyclase/mutase family protein [Planctomycetes bacterium]|jgi:hypothetical protein|nr:terpene cyclase/mutase family protein [Planctomycetota bacterium]